MTTSIKAIDTASVHRIHAGQVVLDLQGAIKELVENSLDAGATIIEVRIREHGLGGVEVVDNGSGIGEGDWQSIGLKHHTSKLPSLAELPQVTTFGFRGEALSSLCVLCDSVVVTTATRETAPLAAVIKLGRDGRVLDSAGRVARQRGTTVALAGLFAPLPVRRKEYERNAKREFGKALALLTAYALVPSAAGPDRPGVRLKVDAIAGKADKRSTVLATDGKGSLRAAVAAVWGPKALDSVVDVALDVEVDVDRAMARREGLGETAQTVRVTGLVSSAAWGQGRASADRQFFYINGRPCVLLKVAKAVNDVYKSFNTNQVPLAVLNFEIPKDSIDINVSPDKRTIFVHSEANLVEALRAALDAFWQPTRSAFAVGGASQTVQAVRLVQRELAGFASQAPHKPGQAVLPVEAGGEASDDDWSVSDKDGRASPEPAAAESDAGTGSARRAVPARTASLSQPVANLPSAAAGPSRVRSAPTPAPAPRRPTQVIDTTGAAWSVHRQAADAGAAAGKHAAAGSGGGVGGRAARASLRDRLKGYASQTANGAGREGTDSDDEDELDGESDDDDELDDDELDDGDKHVDGDQITGSETDTPNGDEEDGATDPALDEGGPATTPPAKEPPVADVEVLCAQPERAAPDARRAQASLAAAADSVHDTAPADVTSPARPAERARSAAEPVFADEAPIIIDDEGKGQGEEESGGEGDGGAIDVDAADVSDTDDVPLPTSLLARRASSPAGADYRSEIQSTGLQGAATLRFDLPRLRRRYAALSRAQSAPSSGPPAQPDAHAALARGAASSAAGLKAESGEAAVALARHIDKTDFARMEVLGQFNKGFIIARLRGEAAPGGATDDLFIIDQHASDEKFNFETLQRTTVIKGQALIRPRPLQLTAADELVAIENLDVLRANGFGVVVDEHAAPGRGARVSLAAMPVSKETVFDFTDLEQLLHLLSDGCAAGQMVRCTKARAMFASRACRRSVMIGKSLTRTQMGQLLRNMGTIDQPWNCPHGRPTMRHLHALERRPRAERAIDWAAWAARPA